MLQEEEAKGDALNVCRLALSPLRRGSNAIKLAAVGNLQRGPKS